MYILETQYLHALTRNTRLKPSVKPRDDGNVPEAHEEGLEYGDNMVEIAADNMAATFAAVGDPEA